MARLTTLHRFSSSSVNKGAFSKFYLFVNPLCRQEAKQRNGFCQRDLFRMNSVDFEFTGGGLSETGRTATAWSQEDPRSSCRRSVIQQAVVSVLLLVCFRSLLNYEDEASAFVSRWVCIMRDVSVSTLEGSVLKGHLFN